jgi:hypothetical protein
MRRILILLILLFLYSCSEPCLDLANRICDCEPTLDRRNTCKRIFVTNNPVSISDNEQNRCEELLKTCNCSALDAGNLAACGLAKYPSTIEQ